MCRLIQSYNLRLIAINYFECRKHNVGNLVGKKHTQVSKLKSIFEAARKSWGNRSNLRIDLIFPNNGTFLQMDSRFIEISNHTALMAIKKTENDWYYENFENLLNDKIGRLLDIYNNDPLFNAMNEKNPYQNTQSTKPEIKPMSYTRITAKCQLLFAAKLKDYGASWACMRMVGYVEQLLIKANRIRTIQENKAQKIADSIEDEFIGLYNYAIMACMKIESPSIITDSLASAVITEYIAEKIEGAFVAEMEATAKLMQAKDSDYGQAWRMLSIAGITDFILTKIYRLRQIYANNGEVKASEKPIEIFKDIANYAIFALILMSESEKQ